MMKKVIVITVAMTVRVLGFGFRDIGSAIASVTSTFTDTANSAASTTTGAVLSATSTAALLSVPQNQPCRALPPPLSQIQKWFQ